ncbi:hypothetical protein C4D60_Mb07t10440 [Musa balbisiana]|uniref:Protein kinase domain-containing protein n=1 Tax=Musa balbisiana TaxID=52838 RepID=A0A4S8JFI9_MUSBA|nr:hypothetical protein C4D60_Mb07t10440 [Musa balbisiana]
MVCSCFNALLSKRKHHQHSEQETGDESFVLADLIANALPEACSMKILLESNFSPMQDDHEFLSLFGLGDTGFSSDKNVRLISYDELRSATDNFHQSNKIGRGGFGTVYKGTLRNRVAIAVKVLSAESKQGVNEFLTEIDAIANVRHPNLVELIGCCAQGSSRILVYEYMENSSLDRALLVRSFYVLQNSNKKNPYVPIIQGKKYISLIPLSSFHVGEDVKSLSTFWRGFRYIRLGYLAPEYAMQGQLTKKADVYSFGVLVIEIISSRSSSKTYWSGLGQSLLEWTWQLFGEGRIKEVIDPALQEYPEEQVLRFIKVGLFCTQATAGRRPSMPQVVEMLSKPMKLNEKELTPPGVVGGSSFMNRVPKATNSSNTQFNESTTSATAVASASNPSFLTQMIPR